MQQGPQVPNLRTDKQTATFTGKCKFALSAAIYIWIAIFVQSKLIKSPYGVSNSLNSKLKADILRKKYDGVLAGRDVPGAMKTLQVELEKIAR